LKHQALKARLITRAFSAEVLLVHSPGALPQANDECRAFGAKQKTTKAAKIASVRHSTFVTRHSAFVIIRPSVLSVLLQARSSRFAKISSARESR